MYEHCEQNPLSVAFTTCDDCIPTKKVGEAVGLRVGISDGPVGFRVGLCVVAVGGGATFCAKLGFTDRKAVTMIEMKDKRIEKSSELFDEINTPDYQEKQQKDEDLTELFVCG